MMDDLPHGALPALQADPSQMSLATFARNALADYRSTAAIVPSSQHLANAMVDPLRDSAPRVVVEFGPGTGVMTRELLSVLSDDGILLAFEISPRFVKYLRHVSCDGRLRIVQAGAETAVRELARRGIDRVDAVVSSLGLGMMDRDAVDAIFRPLLPALGRDGIAMQFQYFHRTRLHGGRFEYFDAGQLMRRYFRRVRSNRVWRNFPPAHVITCTRAKTNPAAASI